MKVQHNDAEAMACAFFELIDAHYGGSIHHIGDGDGLSEDQVKIIKDLYVKYKDAYWKDRAITIVI